MPRSRIGLALAGGGFLGIAYELGTLAALTEAIEDFDPTDADVYVGVSAGAFVGAGLANGLSAREMLRLFVEEPQDGGLFDPGTLLRPAWGEIRQALAGAPPLAWRILRERMPWAGPERRAAARWWSVLDRAARLLPTGLFDAAPAEARLAQLFTERGRTDDFGRLRRPLSVIATDLDAGTTVEFGPPPHDRVPISRAVRASSAVPGLFPPVEIDGRRFVDGALNKTMHASVALAHGAQLVLCLNPLVPYAPASASPDRRGSIARHGLPAVLAQTVRTTIRSRMAAGMERYAISHPQADVLLFEPASDDPLTFFARLFDYGGRRRLCEHAYQQARVDLLARAAALAPVLQRHGLSLRTDRLSTPAVLFPDEPVDPLAADPASRPPRSRGALRLARALDAMSAQLRAEAARRPGHGPR